MTISRISTPPLKKLGFFEGVKKEHQEAGHRIGWNLIWNNEWYPIPGDTSRLKKACDGYDFGSEVCIFTFRDEDKVPVFRFCYYRCTWYQATSSSLHLSEEDVEILVKAKHQRLKDRVKRAKEYLEPSQASETAENRQTIPRHVQIFVWQRDSGKCVNCGSQINLEFDHVIPVSKGGANTARNIQLLCESCNRSKGSKIGR